MKNRKNQKCKYCDNLLGEKGSLGMCNKHYIQYKRHGDPLYSDKKPRATVDGYYRDGKTGRREHRVIYENHYGIKLSDEQVIHHINFVKTDNRIENLWLYENASEHVKAHREYERLMSVLKENEKIIFDNGKYVIREREITFRQTIDLSINKPRVIQIANCIKARYDSGISNQRADGSGVVELQG